MRVAVVSSSALGTNCWSALRMVGTCYSCSKYDSCKYPERVANAEYDAIVEEARALKALSDKKFKDARDMRASKTTS